MILPKELLNINIPVSEQGINFLVAGKNGSLVDTIIYVHVDIAKQRVTLISVPRDLYYNNRKINAVYSAFGMGEFKRELADITGYTIDKYILIDMYAFLDLVDTLGGVDITLEKAVIDPSYKVYENGQWGTLYYPPGTYHLNGRQALRLARSRHYSSDFERAKRQHLILEALKSKTLALGAGDADKILKMIQIALASTESDITPQEALAYFFRFRDFTVRKENVLSTANVLTSYNENNDTRQNAEQQCTTLNGTERELCLAQAAEIGKGQYRLKPTDDNRNLIKWFFRNTFEEN